MIYLVWDLLVNQIGLKLLWFTWRQWKQQFDFLSNKRGTKESITDSSQHRKVLNEIQNQDTTRVASLLTLLITKLTERRVGVFEPRSVAESGPAAANDPSNCGRKMKINERRDSAATSDRAAINERSRALRRPPRRLHRSMLLFSGGRGYCER